MHYLPWCLSRIGIGSGYLRVEGAKIGGFPNFSSYLGAVSNAMTDEEVDLITRQLENAETVFDVGANFGAFAIPFAKIAPRARIFAFEPNPETAKALRNNIALNGVSNITVVEAAVCDRDGELVFSDTTDPATNHILEDGSHGVRVKSLSLTSFCGEHGIEWIDFLKIDVEGAELAVLAGAQPLFDKRSVSGGVIEICPGNLRNFGCSIAELVAFFANNEFDLELIGPKRGRSIDDRLQLENASFVRRSGVATNERSERS